MSFTASFYNSNAAPNKLTKTGAELGNPITTTCKPYEPMSDLSGYLIIDWVDGIEDYNYVKISQDTAEGETTDLRDRYYFITDWEKEIGGKLKVSLKCDVLMTYKEEIKKLSCICQSAAKQCPKVNSYIANNGYKVSNWTIYSSTDDPDADPDDHINSNLSIDPTRVVIGIYG